MAKQPDKVTSITVSEAGNLLKSAPKGKTLRCKLTTGLRLIKLASSASWQYRYADATGKRRVYTLKKGYPEMLPVKAAEEVRELKKSNPDPLARKAAGKQAAQEAAHRTLRNYLDGRYLRHMERSWKPENVRENCRRLNKQFAHLMDRELSSISKDVMEDWQREQEDRGLAYSTIQRDYGRLKTLLNHAVQEEVIPSNPIATHKLLDASVEAQERLQEDKKKSERRMLTKDEISKLYLGLELFNEQKRQERRNSRAHGKSYLPDLDQKHYAHWFIPYALTGLRTGLRPSDLRTLTWDDVNFNFKRLTKVCEKTKRKKLARGNKHATRVELEITPDLMDVLRKLRDDQGNPESGLLFPSPKTGGVLDKQAGAKPWRHVKELGELPESMIFYAMRHHFISQLLNGGMSIFVAAKMAGHKDPKMIMAHYGHVSKETATQAMDIVEQSLKVEPATKSA